MQWKIPKIWEGQTAYILGGGASVVSQFGIPDDVVEAVRSGEMPMSVYSQYMEALKSKNVIGVNAAFKLGSWMDFIYFMDKDFMLTNRVALANYPKKTVSTLPYTEGEDWCLTVKGNTINGICAMPNTIAYNHNAGAGAINLAYHLGAKRIVLIGFDMKVVSGMQHFHGDYINSELVRTPEHEMGFSKHLQVFPAIKNDAELLGIEIINTSLESALNEFEKIPLERLLYE